MKRIFPILLALLMLFGCATQTAIAPSSAPTTAPEPSVEASVGEDAIELVTPVPTEPPKPTPTPSPVPTEVPTPTPSPTPEPEPFAALPIPDTIRPKRGYTASNIEGVVMCDADGTFYAYGSVGGTEPCFYPCDATGAVAPGERPVSDAFMIPAYTPTDAPKKDGEKLLVVYLGSQSVVGYEAKDGDWSVLRIMICSTGRKNHETPTGSYKITDRYTYKILGTGETHCYGFWACRFKNHYLFHSVPINFDAKKAEQGHSMCDMHKYEKLGTVASDGCVRVTVADAKWIYELSANEKVAVRVVKDSGPTPPQPPAVIWEEPYTDKDGYGWDPTDPDPNNPYLALSAP